jgi:putative glycosyltransferase (TIGR04372 family)
MGKYVASPIKAPNLRVIDYATQCHSDFMDVYLSAKCEFFLGNNSGLIDLPMIFRRPIVCANTHALFAIMEFSYQPSVFIPKLFYCAKRVRHLTFREMLDLGLGQGNFRAIREISNRLGLELLENTPEEIYQAAMEMRQRLQSTFQPSAEDEELQRRFLSILRSYPEVIPLEPGRDEYVKIGTDFLRRHADLLE